MTTRAAAVISLVVLLVALAAFAVVFMPWQPNPAPATGAVEADAAVDFSAAEIARGDEVSSRLRLPGYLGLAVGVVTLAVLGFGPWGARLVQGVARPLGGVVVASGSPRGARCVACCSAGHLGFAVWSETVRLDVGLSTRSWGGWAVDVLKGFAVSSAITLFVAAPLGRGSHVFFREWWWAVRGSGRQRLSWCVVSFLYPLLVEPVFNKFTPMAEGPLRTSLLELAERDGVGSRMFSSQMRVGAPAR